MLTDASRPDGGLGGAIPAEGQVVETVLHEQGLDPPEGGGDLQSAEKALIAAALEATGGNRRRAARRLGISERTLYRKLKHYELG